jgi:Uma2 family endonuclease
MQSLLERLQADDPEERQIISGISWEQYETLLEELGDSSPYRVTYLDGVLELMAPSRRHERNKSTIGSLLEAYCQEKRIRYFPLGSTTLRKQQKRGGTEPDESYCIGSDKEYPDIAIEVIETSGSIDKLEVYQRLGVREIWFFQNQQFRLYALRESGYQLISRSEILPDLDLNLLATAALADDPLEAALEFRQTIRQSP